MGVRRQDQRAAGHARRGALRPHVRVQGARGARSHPRQGDAAGRRDPAVLRARRRHRRAQVPRVRGGERREQRSDRSRRAVRRGVLRRRGADAEALAAPCPRSRDAHPQAHVPHHRDREPALTPSSWSGAVSARRSRPRRRVAAGAVRRRLPSSSRPRGQEPGTRGGGRGRARSRPRRRRRKSPRREETRSCSRRASRPTKPTSTRRRDRRRRGRVEDADAEEREVEADEVAAGRPSH